MNFNTNIQSLQNVAKQNLNVNQDVQYSLLNEEDQIVQLQRQQEKEQLLENNLNINFQQNNSEDDFDLGDAGSIPASQLQTSLNFQETNGNKSGQLLNVTSSSKNGLKHKVNQSTHEIKQQQSMQSLQQRKQSLSQLNSQQQQQQQQQNKSYSQQQQQQQQINNQQVVIARQFDNQNQQQFLYSGRNTQTTQQSSSIQSTKSIKQNVMNQDNQGQQNIYKIHSSIDNCLPPKIHKQQQSLPINIKRESSLNEPTDLAVSFEQIKGINQLLNDSMDKTKINVDKSYIIDDNQQTQQLKQNNSIKLFNMVDDNFDLSQNTSTKCEDNNSFNKQRVIQNTQQQNKNNILIQQNAFQRESVNEINQQQQQQQQIYQQNLIQSQNPHSFSYTSNNDSQKSNQQRLQENIYHTSSSGKDKSFSSVKVDQNMFDSQQYIQKQENQQNSEKASNKSLSLKSQQNGNNKSTKSFNSIKVDMNMFDIPLQVDKSNTSTKESKTDQQEKSFSSIKVDLDMFDA